MGTSASPAKIQVKPFKIYFQQNCINNNLQTFENEAWYLTFSSLNKFQKTYKLKKTGLKPVF